MSEVTQPRCADLEHARYDVQTAAEETWQAMLSAGVFVEGNFRFASRLEATLKADAEQLYTHPTELAIIMGHFAAFPCVQDADVLLYVPDGMRQFMTLLGRGLRKPVAGVMRVPGADSKYDFMFESEDDAKLALSAELPLIGEDIVTTLGSVAGVRKLLRPEQTVHSLAMLLRGTVNEDYRVGLVDHYLIEREIPTDKVEFHRLLEEEWN